jgi:hypothetical protein
MYSRRGAREQRGSQTGDACTDTTARSTNSEKGFGQMNERKIRDWSELNEVLFQDTWRSDIQRFRSTFAYRGVGVENWPLTNSLSRLGKPYKNMEQNLLKQFKKYAQPHVVERDTEWHWLSVAQHYGLPIRLLDWTYSPFVALHFATSELEYFGEDAAVWKVNYSDVHALLQNAQKSSLEELGARIFSIDALAKTIESLEALDKLKVANFDAAIFFEPPAIDDRIVNQFAYFSVLSDPRLSMDEWLERSQADSVNYTKVIIPSGLKWEIRDKLDQSNITERVLMPGLGGLCSWLKRHYMPRHLS